MAAAGLNPYALAPAAEELTPLRDEIWRRMPHKEVPTVYPPLAIAAFSIASRLPFPMLAWKLIGHRGRSRRLLAAPAPRPRRRSAGGTDGLVRLESAGGAGGGGHGARRRPRGGGGGGRRALPAAQTRAGPARRPPALGGRRRPRQAGARFAALPMWARQSGRPALVPRRRRCGLTAVAALPVVAGHRRSAAGAGDLRRLLGVQRPPVRAALAAARRGRRRPGPRPRRSTSSRA